MERITMERDEKNIEQIKPCACIFERFSKYFKIGMSDDIILLRKDFPITQVSPGDFSKLIIEMFRRNEEARHGK